MTRAGQEHAIPGDRAGQPATMTCLGREPPSCPPGALFRSPGGRSPHPGSPRRARFPDRHPLAPGFLHDIPAAWPGFPSPISVRTVRQCEQAAGAAEQAAALARSGPPVRPAHHCCSCPGRPSRYSATACAVLAIPLMVLDLTRNPLLSGLSAASVTVGYLLVGLPAGVLVDRLDPWRVLIAMDAARALLFAALYALSAAGVLRIWLLFVLGLCGRRLCGVLRVRPGRGGQGSVRCLRPDGRELRARAGQPDLADRRSRDRGTARRGRRDQPGPAG